jgi:hypothetical protein
LQQQAITDEIVRLREFIIEAAGGVTDPRVPIDARPLVCSRPIHDILHQAPTNASQPELRIYK